MSGSPTKILVADDSAVFRKLVENSLQGRPFTPLFAKTGEEALRLFEEHRPSLAIVDWMMPDRSGLELCEHIRSYSGHGYTYIILLTAMAEKESVIQGLGAGADDYLTKPFHEGELIARLGVGSRVVDLYKQVETKNRMLEQLALTDALTGLANRRAIEEWSIKQLSGAARYKFPFWVMVADLDHFKGVNDAYGHAAGDTVLKSFGTILKRNCRKSDMCGRIGGEEFLVVLTHTSRENVPVVTDRIREELSTVAFNFDGTDMSVSVSFGVAGFEVSEAAPDFSQLLSRADAALYAAKRGGRNRAEFAESLTLS